jgi:hypothetical protein
MAFSPASRVSISELLGSVVTTQQELEETGVLVNDDLTYLEDLAT